MVDMKRPRIRRVLAVMIVTLASTCVWAWDRPLFGARARSAATVPVTLTAVLKVNTGRPGNEFDPGAVGLSLETKELSTGRLSSNNFRLVRLMRLLGPSVLRIGGDSVDSSWWTNSGEPSPPWATNTVTPTDLSVLHGLLTATDWRVLLGVDLGHFEPPRMVKEARYAQKILGTDLLGIEIGNEPNAFSHRKRNVILRSSAYSVGEYVHEAEAYRRALTAIAPGVALYGPAAGGTQWLSEMGATADMFTELTEHYYPPSVCSNTPSPSAALPPTSAELLSPVAREQEDVSLNALAQAGTVAGRPTRIGETGSAMCTGSAAASSTFASALWSLDWTLRAVSSGVRGLNFHGHLGVCGSHNQSPICAPNIEAAKVGDVAAQPVYYGLLAASRLEGGRFVPTSLTAPDPLPNLTTWATLTTSGTIKIAIDNLALVGLAQPVSIPVSGYTATEESLTGPSVEATNGVTLGSSTVTGAGQWQPRPIRLLRGSGSFRFVVPPANAVIVTLRRDRPRR
jgi:hypothetical protein